MEIMTNEELRKRYIQCMKGAEQWHDKLLELQYVERILRLAKQNELKNLTNLKVGPPTNLNTLEKAKWKHTLILALRKCLEDILIPSYGTTLDKKWENLKVKIEQVKDLQEPHPLLGTYLAKGINRGAEKRKKKGQYPDLDQKRGNQHFFSSSPSSFLPPPPPPLEKEEITGNDVHGMVEIGRTSTEEIGNLKREEDFSPLKNGFVLNERLKATKDISEILAYGIYGRKDRKNFIYRSIVKYMIWYEKRERTLFKPCMMEYKKGGKKRVRTWKEYLENLRRQKSYLSDFEVEIIGVLYQVEIRVFSRKTYMCNNVNNVNNFVCVKQLTKMNNRVLNLLLNSDNTWSYLEGIMWTHQNLNQVKIKIGDTHVGENNRRVKEKSEWEKEEKQFGPPQNTTIVDTLRIDEKEQDKQEGGSSNHIEKDCILIDYETRRGNSEINIQGREKDYIYRGKPLFRTYNISIECSKDKKENFFSDKLDYRKQDISLEDFSQVTLNTQINYIDRSIERQVDNNNIDIIPEFEEDNNTNQLKIGIGNNELSDKDSLDNRGEQNRYIQELSQITVSTQKSIIPELEIENGEATSSESSGLLSITELNREVQDTLCLTESTDLNRLVQGDTNSTNTPSTIARLFPSELISENLDIQHNTHINRREIWQRWRNTIRKLNKLKKKKEIQKKQREEIAQKNKLLVFDYSTIKLDTAEIELLSKGETFCPIDLEIDTDRLKTDIYNYNRRLRLHEQYRDSKPLDREGEVNTQTRNRRSTVVNQSRITRISTQRQRASILNNNQQNKKEVKIRRQPSTYDPITQNRNLIRYTNCIQEDCLLAIQDKIELKDNITKHHRKALSSLKRKIKDKIIIVTKADKGSGIVVLDYELYIKKGTHYIEEEVDAYELVTETEKDIVSNLVKKRDKIVDKLKEEGVIPLQTATYCTRQLEEKITGVKFLYKIHKEEDIQRTPLRPVQSCISAPTHHLSIVLTDILQPLLNSENIPTYIFDSNHLLFRLQNISNIPSSCTLISSDVAALYPSIPHIHGLKAVNNFLHNTTEYRTPQINIIIKALELVITENFMMWNDKIYRQKGGVAMGTPVAVAYANIFMHWVDVELKRRTGFVYEHVRFIDDNLFIVPEDKIEDLMTVANDILPPHIRFTYDKLHKDSDIGLPFLDTQLFISLDNKIESRLYTKKTDRHAYLLPSSYHPPHVTSNIPKAVFKRLRRICSKEEWFDEDTKKAKEWLRERSYKEREIQKAIDKVKTKDRWEMITKIELKRNINTQQAGDLHSIPFIVTYNQYAHTLKKALNKRQDLLDSCFRRTKVKPRLSFRRQKNLGDILVQRSLRGPIRNIDQDTKIFTPCNDILQYRIRCPCKGTHDQQKCRCCIHARFKLEGIETRIWKKVDCNSKNLVYIIGCKLCEKQYVGETQQALRERLMQHLNNINKLNQPLYLHFRLTHKPEHMYISILETVGSIEQMYRKVREAWWINHLQTLEPRGFNVKLDCNQIYREILIDSVNR